jgi:hypothetical protein
VPRLRRFLLATLPAVALAVAGVGPVSAAAWVGHYTFYDCTGPAPSSFTAVKEQLPDTSHNGVSASIAFRLEDGSGVYVVQSFDGFTIAPGIQDRNLVVTCTFNSIEFGPVIFKGFITAR